MLDSYNLQVSPLNLTKRKSAATNVEEIHGGWRLRIERGAAGTYRLAQLDNYLELARRSFPQRAPVRMQLRARASRSTSPGTWGFGLWNDPFGFSLGLGGTSGRLPTLPNATWFFFASPENHLALKNKFDGNGSIAAVISSPRIPSPLLALSAPVLPFLALRPTSRVLRRLAAGVIKQDQASLSHDVTQWHEYEIIWTEEGVDFKVDQQTIFKTPLSPLAPLALVLWIDNQFAAWRPDGSLANGTLATPADTWVEITDLNLN
jgi:hypothetical protein